MPGLVPGIHVLPAPRKVVDGRVPSPPGLRRARSTLGRRSFSVGGKPGHNDGDLRDALSLVSATSPSALALEVADVLLGVELEPDTLDQIELRLEEVDMAQALRAGGNQIGHVHFVDSNRRPAGCGHLDYTPIVAALQAIRYINEHSGRLTIAGVNLSLAVPHDVAAHTCGWTPVCIECDKRDPRWGVELPYRKQTDEPLFYVAPNLYVIGLMNTDFGEIRSSGHPRQAGTGDADKH